jgi:predicted phage tail protein
MFGLGKLQVLESKLDIYEDLSKEMLDKLERAVTTISENSNRVAVVLERHETRLDEGDKSNQLIVKMIEEMKITEEKNHNILHERINSIQKKVDANQRFVIGAGAVLATLGMVAQIAFPVYKSLTSSSNTSMLATAEVVSFVNGSN